MKVVLVILIVCSTLNSCQRSSNTRNGEFYFPAREGRGLAALLPQVSLLGLEALGLMLVYDPENRSSARKILEHRYFADVREREVMRQMRSSLFENRRSEVPDQWGKSVVLGYMGTEKHRRMRLVNAYRSQLRCAETLRSERSNIDAANTRSNSTLYAASCPSRIPQPSKIDDLRQTQVGKYFLRKRMNNYCEKGHQRPNPKVKTTTTTKINEIPCPTFWSKSFHIQKQENHGTGTTSNELPSIYMQSKKNLVYLPDSTTYIVPARTCKMNITGAQDTQIQDLCNKKTTLTRSPLKKMAKRDINDFHLRSTSFNTNKYFPKKTWETQF